MSAPLGPQPRVGALELPPDVSPEVVTLLTLAAGPATFDELSGEAAAVAAFRTARLDAPRPRRRLSVRTVRLAAATLITSVVLGGGLAAADVLPSPAQRWVSHALGVVGIDVPSPDRPQADGGPALFPADASALDPASAQLPGRPSLPGPLVKAGAGRPAATTDSPPAIAPTTAALGSSHRPQTAGIGSAGGATTTSTSGTAAPATSEADSDQPKGTKAENSGAAAGRDSHPAKKPVAPSASSGNGTQGKPAQPGRSIEAHTAAPGQPAKAGGPALEATSS